MKTGGESERWGMSRGKRTKREQTQNWGQIEQYSLWPEQIQYELIRPCVLFHESAATRAQETNRKGKLSFSFFDVACRVYTRVRGQIPENNSCRC